MTTLVGQNLPAGHPCPAQPRPASPGRPAILAPGPGQCPVHSIKGSLIGLTRGRLPMDDSDISKWPVFTTCINGY